MFLKKKQSKSYNKFVLNELQRKIDITTDNLIEHLLMCLLLQNSTGKLSQWEDEIYSSFNRTCFLTGKNNFPSEKVLYNMTLNQFGDTISIWVITHVDQINYKEKVNITDYNSSILENYIIEYYKWLIPILAKGYFVTHEEVNNKIKELIDDYNKNIKS